MRPETPPLGSREHRSRGALRGRGISEATGEVSANKAAANPGGGRRIPPELLIKRRSLSSSWIIRLHLYLPVFVRQVAALNFLSDLVFGPNS